MLQKLQTPFLLRKLVNHTERIANALERIADHIGADRVGTTVTEYDGPDADPEEYYSGTSDFDIWYKSQLDARRLPKPRSHDTEE